MDVRSEHAESVIQYFNNGSKIGKELNNYYLKELKKLLSTYKMQEVYTDSNSLIIFLESCYKTYIDGETYSQLEFEEKESILDFVYFYICWQMNKPFKFSSTSAYNIFIEDFKSHLFYAIVITLYPLSVIAILKYLFG